MKEYNLPDDLQYSKEHVWLRRDGAVGSIGISDFAQARLDDVAYVDLPQVGAEFAAGAEFGTVESIKAVNALYMPIAGKVLEVNSALSDTPTLVNADPYARGWMIKISIPENADQSLLLSAAEYRKGLENS